jgi:hypothetical protein
MRRKYFTESHNSLHEVVGAIDLAEAIGAVDSGIADEVQDLAFRLKGMLGTSLLRGSTAVDPDPRPRRAHLGARGAHECS